MIVAEYIARFLQKHGVTHVFGYDGSMMLKIADEISRTDGIDFYQGFHEQASSFEADAYARVTHSIGVALVTSGPGAVNALAGCADAYMDSVPFLIISGQDRLTHIRTNPGVRLSGFQDLDVVDMARPIAKYAVQLTDAANIAYELEKCIFMAMDGRKGPTLLDVPMDIQFMEVRENIPHYGEHKHSKTISLIDIRKILELIYAAKSPVILAGGGIDTADATNQLAEFVSITGIPVVTTLNGHDVYKDSVGSSGLYGAPEANLAIYYSDLVIAIGTRFGQQQVGKNPDQYTHAKIVHIDIDSKELGRVLKPEIGIEADLKMFLEIISLQIEPGKMQNLDKWKSNISKWIELYHKELYVNNKGIEPVKLVNFIGEICPENTIFTNDVGQNTMWVCQGLHMRRNQRLLTSSGYASMGFSLPAAIGAKMAYPDSLVISFSGDGGFHMNIQELQFVNIHKLDIKFVVFNNNTLGMMREVQRIYYNNNYVGSNTDDFICIDLKKVSALYNMDYVMLDCDSDFDIITEVISSSRATIIDCRLPIDTYLRNWNEFTEMHPEALQRIG